MQISFDDNIGVIEDRFKANNGQVKTHIERMMTQGLKQIIER